MYITPLSFMAFDRIQREVVRWSLWKMGVNEWLIRTVMSLYTETCTVARADAGLFITLFLLYLPVVDICFVDLKFCHIRFYTLTMSFLVFQPIFCLQLYTPYMYSPSTHPNATLRTVTGRTRDTNIQHLHDETLTLPIHETLQLHASQYQHKTQHPSHPLHKHTTYFNTPRLKNTIFNNGRYATNIPTDPNTVTTIDIKTNMRHIHTSIVSRHLATRGNNKILHAPPPHIISSEEILSLITLAALPNPEQINLPFSNHTYNKVDAKTHKSPLCPLCNIHPSSLHLHPHTHHIVTPGFVDRPHMDGGAAGQMEG